jgi:hypothetical protein
MTITSPADRALFGLEQGVPGVRAAAVNRDLLGTDAAAPEHRR